MERLSRTSASVARLATLRGAWRFAAVVCQRSTHSHFTTRHGRGRLDPVDQLGLDAAQHRRRHQSPRDSDRQRSRHGAQCLGHRRQRCFDGESVLFSVRRCRRCHRAAASASIRDAAVQYGWRYSTRARFVSDHGATASMGLSLWIDNRGYFVLFDLDGNNLRATLLNDPNADPTITLTTGGVGATAYHDIALVYRPATAECRVRIRRRRARRSPPAKAQIHDNAMLWGNLSTSGRGQMNFQSRRVSDSRCPATTTATGSSTLPTTPSGATRWGRISRRPTATATAPWARPTTRFGRLASVHEQCARTLDRVAGPLRRSRRDLCWRLSSLAGIFSFARRGEPPRPLP